MLEYSILLGVLSQKPSSLSDAATLFSKDTATQTLSFSTSKADQSLNRKSPTSSEVSSKVDIASPESIPHAVKWYSSRQFSNQVKATELDQNQKLPANPAEQFPKVDRTAQKADKKFAPKIPSKQLIQADPPIQQSNTSDAKITADLDQSQLGESLPDHFLKENSISAPKDVQRSSAINSIPSIASESVASESVASESASIGEIFPVEELDQLREELYYPSIVQAEESGEVRSDQHVGSSVDPELGSLRLREAEVLSDRQSEIDSELGRIRLVETNSGLDVDQNQRVNSIDPELGNLRLRETENILESRRSLQESELDPELGNLRLRETERIDIEVEEQQPDRDVFLTGRVDYFSSDNIFLDDFEPVDDQLLTAEVSLLALPDLGPNTQLIAAVGGDIARYSELTDSNYNKLEFQLGIQHFFLPRTYGEISWRNQQFFATDGDRFLNDHSIQLALGRREYLTPQLTLDGFYQFRLSLAEPNDRSRISNTLGLFLNYDIGSNLDLGLDYQLVLTDYTQRKQNDTYHQVTAQISYDLNQHTRISLYGGVSFGQSSNSAIDFDSTVVGLALNFFVPLF